jgi:hypothetical protein
LLLEIQTNCKELGLKEKISSHCQIFKNSIVKMWKIKNVFTLGPTTQATLMIMKGITNEHYLGFTQMAICNGLAH